MKAIGNIAISPKVSLQVISEISNKFLKTKVLNISSNKISESKINCVITVDQEFSNNSFDAFRTAQKKILEEIEKTLNIKNIVLTIATK